MSTSSQCPRFRRHPWRRGLCIDCFLPEDTHTVVETDSPTADARKRLLTGIESNDSLVAGLRGAKRPWKSTYDLSAAPGRDVQSLQSESCHSNPSKVSEFAKHLPQVRQPPSSVDGCTCGGGEANSSREEYLSFAARVSSTPCTDCASVSRSVTPGTNRCDRETPSQSEMEEPSERCSSAPGELISPQANEYRRECLTPAIEVEDFVLDTSSTEQPKSSLQLNAFSCKWRRRHGVSPAFD